MRCTFGLKAASGGATNASAHEDNAGCVHRWHVSAACRTLQFPVRPQLAAIRLSSPPHEGDVPRSFPLVCDAVHNSMCHLCSNSRPGGSTDAIGNVHICGPFQAVQRMAMPSKRRCHILETWRLAVCPLTVVSCARACPGCVGAHCQRAQQGWAGPAHARGCAPQRAFFVLLLRAHPAERGAWREGGAQGGGGGLQGTSSERPKIGGGGGQGSRWGGRAAPSP